MTFSKSGSGSSTKSNDLYGKFALSEDNLIKLLRPTEKGLSIKHFNKLNH